MSSRRDAEMGERGKLFRFLKGWNEYRRRYIQFGRADQRKAGNTHNLLDGGTVSIPSYPELEEMYTHMASDIRPFLARDKDNTANWPNYCFCEVVPTHEDANKQLYRMFDDFDLEGPAEMFDTTYIQTLARNRVKTLARFYPKEKVVEAGLVIPLSGRCVSTPFDYARWMELTFECLVLLSTPKPVKNGPPGHVKQGVHFIFPNLVVSRQDAVILTEASRMVDLHSCPLTPPANGWDNALDTTVHGRSNPGLRIPYNKKASPCPECKAIMDGLRSKGEAVPGGGASLCVKKVDDMDFDKYCWNRRVYQRSVYIPSTTVTGTGECDGTRMTHYFSPTLTSKNFLSCSVLILPGDGKPKDRCPVFTVPEGYPAPSIPKKWTRTVDIKGVGSHMYTPTTVQDKAMVDALTKLVRKVPMKGSTGLETLPWDKVVITDVRVTNRKKSPVYTIRVSGLNSSYCGYGNCHHGSGPVWFVAKSRSGVMDIRQYCFSKKREACRVGNQSGSNRFELPDEAPERAILWGKDAKKDATDFSFEGEMAEKRGVKRKSKEEEEEEKKAELNRGSKSAGTLLGMTKRRITKQ